MPDTQSETIEAPEEQAGEEQVQGQRVGGLSRAELLEAAGVSLKDLGLSARHGAVDVAKALQERASRYQSVVGAPPEPATDHVAGPPQAPDYASFPDPLVQMAPGGEGVTPQEMFQALYGGTNAEERVEQNINRALGDKAEFGDDEVRGTITHTTRKTVRVYKYHEADDRWYPRQVPRANIAELFKDPRHWLPFCPKCRTASCTSEVNSCRGVPAKKFARCPICRKKVPDRIMGDPPDDPDAAVAQATDPNQIDVGLQGATEIERIRTFLTTHMVAFHSQEAISMGLTNPQVGLMRPAASMQPFMDSQQQAMAMLNNGIEKAGPAVPADARRG